MVAENGLKGARFLDPRFNHNRTKGAHTKIFSDSSNAQQPLPPVEASIPSEASTTITEDTSLGARFKAESVEEPQ